MSRVKRFNDWFEARYSPLYGYRNQDWWHDGISCGLAGRENDEPFEDALLSDLFECRNLWCIENNFRPLRFMLATPPPQSDHRGYDFSVEIDGLWYCSGFGWNSLIKPRTPWNWWCLELRQAVAGQLAQHKSSHPACEKCGATEYIRAHHVQPEFADWVRLIPFSLKDIEAAFKNSDLHTNPDFSKELEDIVGASHSQCVLQTLCEGCHHIEHRPEGGRALKARAKVQRAVSLSELFIAK